ncbi:MAG: hypothetical protein SF187_24850 [Deltaproteobacteria bacterium]|nr:hypothetical protein [Deltaproteobacteria bacterium]
MFRKFLRCSLFYGCVSVVTACSSSGGSDDAQGGNGGGEAGQGGEPAAGGKGGDPASGGSGGKNQGGSGGASGGGMAGSAPLPANADFGLDTRPANTTCKDPGRPTGAANDPFPKKLSATGCFDATDPRKPAPGLIPYGVASPLWSDNAEKHRWMALPEGKKVRFTTNGDFDFPNGTVLLKSFALDGVMLETRFLIRHSDGMWGAYTYKWDDAGKDAELLGEGSDSRFLGDNEWTFPSRTNCATCHTEAAGRSLGPDTLQFNGLFDYPMGKRANQLKTLDHIGVFETAPGDLAKLPALPTPVYTVGATLEQRARSYLHANCSHCHQPGGTIDPRTNMDAVSLDFRYDTPFKMMGICNVVPSKNDYGYQNIKLLTPGDSTVGQFGELTHSMISVRMHSKVSNVRMPQIGTAVPDPLGTQLIDEWIQSIKACP